MSEYNYNVPQHRKFSGFWRIGVVELIGVELGIGIYMPLGLYRPALDQVRSIFLAFELLPLNWPR